MLKAMNVYRMLAFLDLYLCLQNLVDPLHGSQTFGNVISGLGKLFQRIDNGVEHHQVIDKLGAAERMVVENKDAADPKHDDDHHRAEKLAHRVGKLLSDVHAHDVVAVAAVDAVKALVHLFFRTEGFNNAQSAQCLLDLAHGVAPQSLCRHAARFELTADKAHEPAKDRNKDNGEQRELPRHDKQCREIGNDQDRIFEQHIQTGHDAVLDLLHVTTHAGDDVTLALLREEAEVQRGDLAVELVTDVAHHTRTDGDDGSRGKEVGSCLQSRHERKQQADGQQRIGRTILSNEALYIIIGVVGEHVGELTNRVHTVPADKARDLLDIRCLEQDLQDGDERHKREDVQYRGKDIEHDAQHQILLIGRNEAPQYLQEFFHKQYFASWSLPCLRY